MHNVAGRLRAVGPVLACVWTSSRCSGALSTRSHVVPLPLHDHVHPSLDPPPPLPQHKHASLTVYLLQRRDATTACRSCMPTSTAAAADAWATDGRSPTAVTCARKPATTCWQ